MKNSNLKKSIKILGFKFSSNSQTFKDFPWLSLHAYQQDYRQEKKRENNFQSSHCCCCFIQISSSITSRHDSGGGDKHQGCETPGGKEKKMLEGGETLKRRPSPGSTMKHYWNKTCFFSTLLFLMSTFSKAISNTWKKNLSASHSCLFLPLFPCRCRSPSSVLHPSSFTQTALIILPHIKAYTWLLL